MEQLWFGASRSRRIILRQEQLLVGRAPEKSKRVKMLCTMPLTGYETTGFPDWLAEARDFVMKTGETVSCAIEAIYANVTMSDQNLFQTQPIEAPRAKLSHMVVTNEGDSEDPTCVLRFQMVSGFSTDLHRWCGQSAGEEFDSQYEILMDQEEAVEDSEFALQSPSEDVTPKDDDEENELVGPARRRLEKIGA